MSSGSKCLDSVARRESSRKLHSLLILMGKKQIQFTTFQIHNPHLERRFFQTEENTLATLKALILRRFEGNSNQEAVALSGRIEDATDLSDLYEALQSAPDVLEQFVDAESIRWSRHIHTVEFEEDETPIGIICETAGGEPAVVAYRIVKSDDPEIPIDEVEKAQSAAQSEGYDTFNCVVFTPDSNLAKRVDHSIWCDARRVEPKEEHLTMLQVLHEYEWIPHPEGEGDSSHFFEIESGHLDISYGKKDWDLLLAAHTEGRAWTVLEVEGHRYLTSGLHRVNRDYHLISKQPILEEHKNKDFPER